MFISKKCNNLKERLLMNETIEEKTLRAEKKEAEVINEEPIDVEEKPKKKVKASKAIIEELPIVENNEEIKF